MKQIQNLTTDCLLTHMCFVRGANLVGPKIEKLSQRWSLMVPYPLKKYAFDFIKNSTPLCERDICNSWMALHNFVHPLSSSQWGESLSEGTIFMFMHLCFHIPIVSFSSCQRNLIKTFQIEGMIALITKMDLIFSWELLNGQK